MELGTAGTISNHYTSSSNCDERIVEQRLSALIDLNAEIAREKALFSTNAERVDASLMTSPIDSRKAYSYFGLMIGTLPPFAMVFKGIGETMPSDRLSVFFLLL